MVQCAKCEVRIVVIGFPSMRKSRLTIIILFRTRTRSILQANPLWGPNKNLYLFAAFCGSLCIALIILYVPVFNDVLGTSPIPVKYWFIPFGWGAAILMVDEIRKLLVRTYPNSLIARIAW